MADSERQQARIKSRQLVGQFMQLWSFLENTLDLAAGAALGLTNLQTVIVAVNIPFAAKIHITKTAVNSGGLPPDRAKYYDRHLNKLWKLNEDRTIIVHYTFAPTEDNAATRFMVAQAKGKLKFPEIIWSEGDFKKRFRQIYALDDKLQGLAGELKAIGVSRAAFIQGLAEALGSTASSGTTRSSRFPIFPQSK